MWILSMSHRRIFYTFHKNYSFAKICLANFQEIKCAINSRNYREHTYVITNNYILWNSYSLKEKHFYYTANQLCGTYFESFF